MPRTFFKADDRKPTTDDGIVLGPTTNDQRPTTLLLNASLPTPPRVCSAVPISRVPHSYPSGHAVLGGRDRQGPENLPALVPLSQLRMCISGQEPADRWHRHR